MLPLASYRAPGNAVLIGPEGEVSAGVFFAQARALSAALPARAYAINACDSRHGFMLGYAASLMRGQTSLFPPGRGIAQVTSVLQRHPDAYVVGDHADLQAAFSDQMVDVRTFMQPAAAEDSDPKGWANQKDEVQLDMLAPIDPAHVAAILFTSGSTGEPSACVKTWGQLCAGAAALARVLGWDANTRHAVVGSVPPQHMFGLESTVMLPWCFGIPVHASLPLLPADLQAALDNVETPSWWMATPLHLRAVLSGRVSFSGLAGVLTSTMSLPATLAQAAESAWRVPVLEIYGSTETGAIAARRTAGETLWTPLLGVKVEQVTQSTQGGVQQDEEAKPVRASGVHIDPPVLLSDLLRIEADGRFLWLGRAGDLIKVAGKRGSLSSLNKLLTETPGVDDGVCFFPKENTADFNDGQPMQRLAALYVSATLSPKQVLDALRPRMDAVFLPRPVFRVAKLPRNANGKLPVSVLSALYERCKAGAAHEDATPSAVIALHPVPNHHPAIAGHFPGNPVVPGALILARVYEALHTHLPHFQPGELISARFHAPLRPGLAALLQPEVRGGQLRFEVRLAASDQSFESGILILSGSWAAAALAAPTDHS